MTNPQASLFHETLASHQLAAEALRNDIVRTLAVLCGASSVAFGVANLLFDQPLAFHSFALFPVVALVLVAQRRGQGGLAARLLVWGFLGWALFVTVPLGPLVMLLSPIVIATVLAGLLLSARSCSWVAVATVSGFAVSAALEAFGVTSPPVVAGTPWFWLFAALPTVSIIGFALVSVAKGRARLEISTDDAQRALAASENRWRTVLANAADILLTVTPDGKIEHINRSISGSTEQVVGKNVLDFVPAESAEAARAFIGAAEPGQVLEQEFEVLNTDGVRRWFYGRAASFVDPERGPRVVIAAADISERKRFEEDLRVAEETLRQAQKLEAVGRLAGGIAHDFNNALSAILGYAELIGDSTADPAVRADAAEIVAVTRHAATLPRQLLAFSRRQPAHPQPIDVNRVILANEAILRRLAGESVELELSLVDGASAILADQGQLEQVLFNLTINARDAMPDGGRLCITTRDASPMREYFAIEVRDTGVGMDPETLDKVFEPFFTTKGEAGTGLGLSTVHGIMTQCGGNVAVDSTVGEGTIFTLIFDAVDAEEALRRPEPVFSPLTSGRTILVAEDEAPLRRVLQRTLEHKGYTAFIAADYDAAVKLFDEHRGAIEALLTDVVMPGKSGVELAAFVRSHDANLPVLFMSGYNESEVLADSVREGRDHFISKPFTPNELISRLNEITRPPMRTALLVDETEVVRRNYRRALEAADFVVLDAATPADALKLARTLHVAPSIVIADMSLRDQDGRDVLSLVRDVHPNVLALVVSGVAPHGALSDEFLLKPTESGRLIETVKRLVG